MSDREALLAAIRSAPDDDLPRLVYADWLEENAESLRSEESVWARDRASFIRAQIEASRAEPYSPAARAAGERANHLLTPANRHAWTAELHGKAQETAFERGFIEHITVDAADFPDAAESLFDAEPIRGLRLVRPNPRFTEWEVPLGPCFEVPRLQQIAALDLQNVELQFSDCERLADSPALAGLTSLSLRGNPIFPHWIRDILESESWPRLARLDLADIANLGPSIADGFWAADRRRFKSLDLSGIGFRSDDLKRALSRPCVSEVEELRVRWDGNAARPGSLTHLELGWVLPWQRLRLLDLEGQGIGHEGVREIVRHDQAAALRWLGLARNHLGPESVRMLAEDSNLRLHYLDVRHNGLGAKDVQELQRRFPDALIVV
jgi:uncharacterized protein (TIGR02996 family)